MPRKKWWPFAKKTFPALQKHPNLAFEVMDARKIKFLKQFDLQIFSNAALHWVDGDHQAILRGAASVLKPGGRLVVSCGGRGNAHDVFLALRPEMRLKQCGVDISGRWNRHIIFTVRPKITGKWLPKFGFEAKRVELVPKDVQYAGAEGFAIWLRTTLDTICAAGAGGDARGVHRRGDGTLPDEVSGGQGGQYPCAHGAPGDRGGQKLTRKIFCGKVLITASAFRKFPHSIINEESIQSRSRVRHRPAGFQSQWRFLRYQAVGHGQRIEQGTEARFLALIVSETPATVAGMFTTNQICAAHGERYAWNG